MRLFVVLMSSTLALVAATPMKPDCAPFPPSEIEFASDFKQPESPMIKHDFTASFVQHKWNVNLSHITQGYITNSGSKNLVRVDQGNDDGPSSSVFDYKNVTKDGLVDNTLTTYAPGSSKPVVWRGYVNSNFPIFQGDILVKYGAVFTGLVDRDFVGRVASWSMMYQGVIPVTAYVDNCGKLVGYDYFAPDLRTRATTRFFNVKA
ncbi:hypothetical protein NLU13_3264 [Sarocladium strictum]|uniref:Uncharacterized protein n=1 Tax=Sarocladium strictum TaxID=5046 RepID=A0AA39GM05_SARSR|nr:hypothetical protein NLU13_3264 [Sarocladium strictum]